MAAGLSIRAGLLFRMLPSKSASAGFETEAVEAVGGLPAKSGLLTKAAAAAACFNMLTVSLASVGLLFGVLKDIKTILRCFV